MKLLLFIDIFMMVKNDWRILWFDDSK